jgi:dipeptidyl aminopeptidase/acylaminoacyl peptidase
MNLLKSKGLLASAGALIVLALIAIIAAQPARQQPAEAQTTPVANALSQQTAEQAAPPTAVAAPLRQSTLSPAAAAEQTLAAAQTARALQNATAAANATATAFQAEVEAYIQTVTATFRPKTAISAANIDRLQLLRILGLSSVYNAQYSPDGRTLAVAGSMGIWLCDPEDFEQMPRLLEGHTDTVWSVAWSPDGRALASGSRDRTVRVWDAAAGQLAQTLEGHTDDVSSVAWSPDGRFLASASLDGTVRVWDAASWTLLRTLEGHTGAVISVAWSPDGRYLASGFR